MKSLAHPQWPYTGTSFEWRGFGHKPAVITVTATMDMPKAWPMFVNKENVEWAAAAPNEPRR